MRNLLDRFSFNVFSPNSVYVLSAAEKGTKEGYLIYVNNHSITKVFLSYPVNIFIFDSLN